MTLPITTMYASLTSIIILFIAVSIVRMRLKFKIGLADGGNEALLRQMRVHENLIEYVPMVFILMALYELHGGNVIVLHLFGAVFFLSRLYHAWGFSRSSGRSRGRVWGTAGTWFVFASLILLNLYSVLFEMFVEV